MYAVMYELDTTPAEEMCASRKDHNWRRLIRIEAAAFKAQIIREIGEPPLGTELKLERSAWDGDIEYYYELKFRGDYEDREHVEYMMLLDGELSARWDAESLAYLRKNGYVYDLGGDCVWYDEAMDQNRMEKAI